MLALSSPLHEYTDYSNYAIFFFALATRAKRYGYDILLLMHEYGDRELTRIARSGMVDGILLLDVLMTDSRAEVAAMLDVPVVCVGYPSNSEAVYSVDLDFERMGREAMEKGFCIGAYACTDRRQQRIRLRRWFELPDSLPRCGR